MALTKREYTDFDYNIPITADNMNAIQDEIIDKCVTVESKSFTAAEIAAARGNLNIPSTNALADLTYTVVKTF